MVDSQMNQTFFTFSLEREEIKKGKERTKIGDEGLL